MIRLTQRGRSSGCPEIWQPVTRRFLIEATDEVELETVVMMNWLQGDQPLQTLTIDRKHLAMGEEAAFDGPTIKTSPMFPGHALPVLDAVAITPGKTEGYLRNYKISFGLHYPFRPEGENSIRIHLGESRTGVSDRTGQPVVNWMFILVPVEQAGEKANSRMAISRHSFIVPMLQIYKHTLVVVNPESAQHGSAGSLFRVYPFP
ncbi:MAG: hypothetical protein GY703_13010 [Gammaproteobacteria bacterium]|nr:hypothetical protein [Gammaproteobacteria bacterium]